MSGMSPPNVARAGAVGAIVGGEDHNGVLREAELVQRIEHSPDDGIALHQGIAELADAGCAFEALRRQVRKVRPGDRQIEEERFARRLLALHEIDAAIHQFPVDFAPHLRRVGLDRLERLASLGLDDLRPLVERDVERLGLAALADHPERIPGVAGRDAVEFVETLVLRLAVGLRTEMPLAEDCGGIAGIVQHLRHGDFLRRKRDVVPSTATSDSPERME